MRVGKLGYERHFLASAALVIPDKRGAPDVFIWGEAVRQS
jgi:hypothetical protein